MRRITRRRIDSLLKIGIRPWFNLGYGNRLYTPEKPDDMSVGWAPVFDEKAEAAWLRFVGKLAGHFADRVRHWEIWNEPNIKSFWKPREPDPADYVAMVEATVPVIRLLEPWPVRPLSMKIPTPDRAAIEEPVLIDPRSQQTFKLPNVKKVDGSLMCEQLPLKDYPMIVADAAIL